MRNVNKFLAIFGLTTACVVAAATSAYAGVAGYVQFVSGNVQIISPAGLTRTIQKGDAVNEGDTLTSAQQSSAQIKMQDGGFIAVRANTKLKIDQFRFNGQADGSERNFFSLIKGGFRSITGLIGQVNKQNYRVTTPAATIGIRGTDYEAVYVEAEPVNVAAAYMLLAQTDAPSPIMGGGFAAAIVNKGAIEMGTNKGATLLQPGQGMVVSYGMSQLPVIKPLDLKLFPGAGKDKPTGQAGNKGANGEKKDDTKKDNTKKEQGASGANGKKGDSSKSADNGQGSNGSTSESTGNGGAKGSATQGGTAAATTPGSTSIRETAVVDAVSPSTGNVPAAITPVVSASTNVTAVTTPTTNTQTVPTTATIAGGTTVNLTTGTATTNTGQTVPITQSLVASQAQAAANAALLAAQAAQAAALATAQANTSLTAIATVPVTPATTAISTATSELSLATTAVSAAAALAPANAATAAANATSAQTTATNAATQANAAQAALTANGAFADSTAGAANAAVQAANSALQTANTSVQAAVGTVTAQNTALGAAQNAASTALTSANTRLSTANADLNTANAQNAVIANAKLAVPAQMTAAQAAAAAAQSAATAAQAAAAQAATLQAAGDLVGAQAQLAIAQQQLVIAQSAQTAASNAKTTATTELGNAQMAVIAASSAVTNAANTASLAASDALTAGSQASAAQTAATNAAAALALTDPTVSTSPAGIVQLQSTVVTQQAPLAAYNNPAVATTNRFVGVMSTVQPDTSVGGSGYIEGYGPGAGFTGTGTANTSFVLDGAGNLVEKRHAWYEETAASTATPQVVVIDANVKRTGGVAVETFKMADNSIYAGRWVGGSITVSDNVAVNPIPTFTRNLGLTSEHWAIMLAPPTGYVQTLTGITTYTKVAATSPTDALGTAGVLNTATLTANFTSQLVDATLNLTISGKTLDVVAAGMAINGSSFSTVTQATATCTGCVGTYYANVGGGFAGDAAASAGLNYTLWTGAAPGATTGATDLIQGIAAFNTATAPTVSQAQPFVQTDVSFELSANSGYGTMLYYGSNSMTAATNVAPTAATPSFAWNYGCIGCGSYTVTLPGATGAVNGNATSFATTGIQFGRWTNVPTISDVSSAIAFGPGNNNSGYGVSSWAFAPEGYLDTPTTLSSAVGGTATGVFSYALNGASIPQDSVSGMTGALNSLTLTADFTAQTVTAALQVSLGATTWNASSATPIGIGAFNGTSAGFSGSLTVTSNNVSVSTSGYLNGAFTGHNYAGAIVDYSIQEWSLTGGATTASVTGVAALTRNGVAGNATVANGGVPATGKFVVAEAGSFGTNIVQTVDVATTTGGVLTSYSQNMGTGNSSTTTINCVTCTGQAATDTATGIQFGTWSAGTRAYSYTTPFGGSLHWIKGPGLDPIYLPEVLLGSMSYTLDGGTAPTNQSGLAGTLSSASLMVNFTNQTVDLALGLTGVNGHNWAATATGVPLSWTNYSKNGFWINSGTMGNGLNVTMDGVAVTPVAAAATGTYSYISGQLTGRGLNGALFQYQLNASTMMPTVPSTFTSADMVTVQAPSVTVTGPIMTGGTVSVAFPAGINGTLAVQPTTALSMGLDANGLPISASLSGGVAATVPVLTTVGMGAYKGTASVSGETFSLDTLGHLYNARYSSFGEWRLLPTPAGLAPVTATGPFSSGEFAGGMLLTPVASMPLSNSAVSGNYYGSMVGGAQDSATNTPYSLNYGTVSLYANFTTGALSGTASNIQVLDRNTGGFVGYFNDLSLAATIPASSNAFSGSVTANAASTAGTASPVNVTVGTMGATSGHFFGPQANELTGIWQMTSGTIKASGAFGAGNGTSFTAPTETVNGTVALVTATPANTAMPYRMVGMSAYDPAAATLYGGLRAEGGYNNATRVTEIAAGVTAFDAGINVNNTMANTGSSRFAIGTATQTGLGTDPLTGISWGRWVGGMVDVTDRATGIVSPSALGTGSLHWIATPSMTAPVALPTTGTYSYVLAGGTVPTDNVGNVGTLNSASLVANFTAQTVNVGVSVGINNAAGATTLVASGTGIPIQQRSFFNAQTSAVTGMANQLTASCTGVGCATATPGAVISGGFTGATGAGAAMIYGFSNGGTVVNGVAAFHR